MLCTENEKKPESGLPNGPNNEVCSWNGMDARVESYNMTCIPVRTWEKKL